MTNESENPAEKKQTGSKSRGSSLGVVVGSILAFLFFALLTPLTVVWLISLIR